MEHNSIDVIWETCWIFCFLFFRLKMIFQTLLLEVPKLFGLGKIFFFN